MKKIYNSPVLQVVCLERRDMITTSGPMSVNNDNESAISSMDLIE